MEKGKGTDNRKFIVIIVLLAIAVLGLGGYILLSKDANCEKYVTENEKTNKENESTQENDKTNSKTEDTLDTQSDGNTTSQTNFVVPFNSSKAINNSGNSYTLSCQGDAGIFLKVDETQKVLTFSFTPTKVVEFYPLNWTTTRNEVASSTMNFDKKIVDVFFGGMGQSVNGDTVFILLEDGTVEYIPIVHAMNHTQAEIRSYGAIDGVSGVTKFSLASTPGAMTTLGIKSDGSFYDLGDILVKTGNY